MFFNDGIALIKFVIINVCSNSASAVVFDFSFMTTESGETVDFRKGACGAGLPFRREKKKD